MNDYWTDVEFKALEVASTFHEAGDIALTILSRMSVTGKEIVQICGPISTGGLGTMEKNMARFRLAIDRATENGLFVFNQIPFQQTIKRLSNFEDRQKKYNWEILEIFYRKIFESGYIHRTLFLPYWYSSNGAKWERNIVTKIGIPVEDYPLEWLT